eukprot:g646.t1
MGATYAEAGWDAPLHMAATTFFESHINVLVLLNAFVAGLVLLFKVTVWGFFGKMRELERKALQERLVSYLLFKVVFVGAVLEPDVREFLVWVVWFAVLGFLKMVSLLCRDRFEHLAVNPRTPRRDHSRIIGLLLLIIAADACWFQACLALFSEAGVSVMLLLGFECLTLLLDTLQTSIKYGLHVAELVHEARAAAAAEAAAGGDGDTAEAAAGDDDAGGWEQ